MPKLHWEGHLPHHVIEVLGTKGETIEPIIRKERDRIGEAGKTDKFKVVRLEGKHTKIIRTDWKGDPKGVIDE